MQPTLPLELDRVLLLGVLDRYATSAGIWDSSGVSGAAGGQLEVVVAPLRGELLRNSVSMPQGLLGWILA